jgi:hypothetical protein
MSRGTLAETLVVMLAALALSRCPPAPTDIAGWGTTGTGGWDLTLVALADERSVQRLHVASVSQWHLVDVSARRFPGFLISDS